MSSGDAPDALTSDGELLGGRYRVERKIAEGGMSFVYLGVDALTGRKVAIKVLSPALATDETAMARLRREAALGTRLAHPNVCHIIGMGETARGRPYIVMPFLEGELLCDRTLRLGQIPLETAVAFVTDIANGLAVAHGLGIIHRDLKPENVMLCGVPGQGERAVVMDFGLAKERRVRPELKTLTATGMVVGTPEFMSPEQLRGKPLDARSDIYSLALMTYEMLTGKLPFAGRTQQDLMIARLRSEPIPLRRLRHELSFPAGVERVLLTAVRRSPGDRYDTAPRFARALADAAAAGGSRERGKGVLGRLRSLVNRGG